MAVKKSAARQIAKRYPPYLLARQIAALRTLSEDTDTSVQSLIRRAIDEFLMRRRKPKRAPSE